MVRSQGHEEGARAGSVAGMKTAEETANRIAETLGEHAATRYLLCHDIVEARAEIDKLTEQIGALRSAVAALIAVANETPAAKTTVAAAGRLLAP